MDLSNIKNVSPNRHLFKKILSISISLIVIVGSFYIINNADKDAKNTIEVLRINQDGGIPSDVALTEKRVEKYNIIKKEYTSDMVLSKDMPTILNKYTKYYLRNKSILYKDEFIEKQPKKNEWLYNLEKDREVLTLPYDYLECGGDILMPGDHVRIRVSYEADDASQQVPSDANPNLVITQTQGKTIKTEVLFEDITIKDMLNANSHSIYEVYKEVMKLDESKRQSVMKSEDFLKNIQPKALLLEGTRAQINNYAKYKGFEGKTFLITMLSRNQSSVVLDQLPTLQKEVETWIEKNNQK